MAEFADRAAIEAQQDEIEDRFSRIRGRNLGAYAASLVLEAGGGAAFAIGHENQNAGLAGVGLAAIVIGGCVIVNRLTRLAQTIKNLEYQAAGVPEPEDCTEDDDPGQE